MCTLPKSSALLSSQVFEFGDKIQQQSAAFCDLFPANNPSVQNTFQIQHIQVLSKSSKCLKMITIAKKVSEKIADLGGQNTKTGYC
jgi:hypothetical protein